MISALKIVWFQITSSGATDCKLLYLQKIFITKNILIVFGVSIIHEIEDIQVKIT